MNTMVLPPLNNRDPQSNMLQMNGLYMSLMSAGVSPSNEDNAIKSYFGDFYVKARFSIENTFDKFLSSNPIELRPSKKMEKYLLSTPYSETMYFRADVPEGFNTTYLEYLSILSRAQQRANDIIDNVLIPFEQFVGRLISDEQYRHQIGLEIKQFRNLEKDYEDITGYLAKCFKLNSYKASAPFHEVVKRANDWKEVFEKTSKLRDLYQAFPRSSLNKRLNILYDNLDALMVQISKDQYRHIEKETRIALASGMYSVAKEIELAASTTYRSKVFITVINSTILNTEKVMDEINS